MKTTFTIQYRKSGKSYDGQLYLDPYQWRLEWSDTEGGYHTEKWLPEDIVRTHQNPSLVFINEKIEGVVIECAEQDLWDALKRQYPKEKFTTEERVKKDFGLLKTLLKLAALFILPLILLYWLVVPWAAEKMAMKLPKDYEIKLGGEMFENTLKNYQKDSVLTQLANDFIKNIDFKSDYPLEIAVVKEPQVNAFAIPGGKIVVFDGILKKMETYEEFAALMGHEGAHVSERHSLRQLARNIGGSVFLYLFLGNSDGLTAFFVNNLDNLKSLSYSRNLEMEADDKGLETLDRNHITQQGMVKLFEKLKAESNGAENKYMSFLQTHPLTDDRIEHAQSRAKEQQNAAKNPVLAEIFNKMKENLK